MPDDNLCRNKRAIRVGEPWFERSRIVESTSKKLKCQASWRNWLPPGVRAAVAGGRLPVIVGCVVVVITACSPSSTVAEPNVTGGSHVDALIVSVDEVRRIANYEELTAHSHADLRHPPSGDLNAPSACRAVGTSDLTFGSSWTEFRSAGYHGTTDDIKPGGPALKVTVRQAVAIYPDASTSRGVLHQLQLSLQSCLGLRDPNYDFTLDNPDPSTLRISSRGWNHLYREKKAVLISVGALGIEPAGQIANIVLQNITDRIQ